MLILIFEFVFHLFTDNMKANWLLISLFSVLIELIVYYIVSLTPTKYHKKIMLILLVLLNFTYLTQFIYYQIFNDLLSISTIINNNKAIIFYEIVINKIFKNWYIFIIYIFTSILYLKILNKITIKRNKTFFLIPIFILIIIIYILSNNNVKNIYFNQSIPRQNLNQFGLITTIRLDLRNKFVFNENEIVTLPNNQKYNQKEYNILNTEFPNSDNKEIKEIFEYFKNQIPTNKNKYTGIFKGKNLIIVLAESFSELAIDEEITPTLYKLYNSGFKFNNYYSPLYRVGTADSEYVIDNSMLPIDGKTALEVSSSNYLIYNYGESFKRINYNTYAYHNYEYNYYNRDKYFNNLDYKYKACKTGLEKKMNCNLKQPSDYEMMKSTIDEYINDNPFMTYYVTMSGHINYDLNHDMVNKNYVEVEDLPYSEKSKYYLATQIELDRGLEFLINELDKNNKLKDTVIVVVGDHYPYGLEMENINELSDYERDKVFEKVHMPLIIYNSELELTEINKYCSQIDLLPTILNLFGIEYDSRLLLGKDIMSNELSPIIFQNRNFITEKGKYNAITGEFIGNVNQEYIDKINEQIYQKFRISRLVLENDYYSYLKSK